MARRSNTRRQTLGGEQGRARPDRPLAIDKLVPVVAHAVAVFGDERKASHWLTTPLPLLENRSPAAVLSDDEGFERIDRILTRIEYNIPS
jgi:putative toxin-antitoxin system antitoxin component (TIGR02293 family)